MLLFVLAWVDEVRWIDLEDLGQGVRDVAVHGLFLQNYLDRGVNGPTWSLAVEEHFYLFLPLLLIGLHLGHSGRPIPAARYHAFFGVALLGGLTIRSLHVLIDGGPQVNDFMLTHFRFDSLILAWPYSTTGEIIPRHSARSCGNAVGLYCCWLACCSCLRCFIREMTR